MSKYQCRFRKGFSAQQLLAMLEIWKNTVEEGKIFGAL